MIYLGIDLNHSGAVEGRSHRSSSSPDRTRFRRCAPPPPPAPPAPAGRESARIGGAWTTGFVSAWGGAEIGSTVGLVGGPFAEFTSPIGAFVGSVYFGSVGYQRGGASALMLYDLAHGQAAVSQ